MTRWDCQRFELRQDAKNNMYILPASYHKVKQMKLMLVGCVISLVISTPLLAADAPMGPGQPDWPPPGGVYGRSAATPAMPARAPAPAANGMPRGYMPPYHYQYPAYQQRREAPVLPPGANWPGTAYGYADIAPPPQPGYPVQVVPPPGIPLEGDIMDTTSRPVRNWRPPEGR